ncbi:hypothetical protein ABZ214_05065 [Streptomyces iakyrus]|uniref:hypothetical protein n=1 Tax=Streptomyces iakyrus TaxID=68219 RepID=UPI0033B4D4F4
MWEESRLAFERLQDWLQRRGAGAARAADEAPAHFATLSVLMYIDSALTGVLLDVMPTAVATCVEDQARVRSPT